MTRVHSVGGCVDLGELPVWRGVQERPGVSETLPFVLTSERGVVRLHLDRHDRDAMVRRYSSSAYTFITTPPGASEWGSYLAEGVLTQLKAAVGSLEGKSVLEIGSGSLYLAQRVVQELRARRFVACDPVLNPASSTDAIRVERAYFDPALFADESIDLVLSINNLEHVEDPFQYLSDVRRLLVRSGGSLFVVAPDCTRGLRAGDWGICAHEHLSYFTVESFAATVRAVGYQVQMLKTHDDAIFALLTPQRSEGAVGWCPEEDVLQRAGEGFAASLTYARELLTSLTRAYRRVGVHGCMIAVNHLLHVLGLQEDQALFLFDRDEAKVGRYLPAFHRRIMSPADPMYTMMEAIVVGVTTYHDEIRAYATSQRGISPARVVPLMPRP